MPKLYNYVATVITKRNLFSLTVFLSLKYFLINRTNIISQPIHDPGFRSLWLTLPWATIVLHLWCMELSGSHFRFHGNDNAESFIWNIGRRSDQEVINPVFNHYLLSNLNITTFLLRPSKYIAQ